MAVGKGRQEPRMITSMSGAADSCLSKDRHCLGALLDTWSLSCSHCLWVSKYPHVDDVHWSGCGCFSHAGSDLVSEL